MFQLNIEPLPYKHILSTRVDVIDYPHTTQKIMDWAHNGQSRYVCAANVGVVMEAYDSVIFQRIVNSADIVISDGMSIVWLLRCFGAKNASRVYVPDLMFKVCHAAATAGVPIAFYGGLKADLQVLCDSLTAHFPKLQISYAYAPPIAESTPMDDEKIVQEINASGARIMFVGLGCPKQERWMVEHKGRVSVVMLGVGAAFGFRANCVTQPPNHTHNCGFNVLCRMGQHSVRLGLRYVIRNLRFFGLVVLQFLHLRDFATGKLRSSKMSRRW